MTVTTPSAERTPIGILCQTGEKFEMASSTLDHGLYEVVQITDRYPTIPDSPGLMATASSTRQAVREYGITVMNGEQDPQTEAILTVLSDPFGHTIGTSVQCDSASNDNELTDEPWRTGFKSLSEYLQWRQNRVMFLTGPHASGKTEAARLLHDVLGYPFIDLGPAIRQEHANSGSQVSLGEWITEQEAVLGSDFTDALLSARVSEARSNQWHPLGFVVIGSRSLRGLVYIENHLRPADRLHMHIDALPRLLHDRFDAREHTELTDLEFSEKLERDVKMGIDQLGDAADHAIHNDGDLESFHAVIKRVMHAWETKLPSTDLFYIH